MESIPSQVRGGSKSCQVLFENIYLGSVAFSGAHVLALMPAVADHSEIIPS